MELTALKNIAKAIQQLDEFRSNESNLGSKANVNRLDKARTNLINIIFSNGYELDREHKVKKSIQKRPLL